jgi:type I restriction enzyme S subunit
VTGTPLEAVVRQRPAHWNAIPAWAALRPVKEQGFPSLRLLSVYRDHGVIEKDSRDDNHNRAGEDLSVYQRVLVGDVVMNKMKAWQGSIAVSSHEGIVSPDYQVLRPRGPVLLGRYLHFLLRSAPYISEYSRLAYGIRPNQWRLMYEEFRGVELLVPPADEQHRIAAFLERETATIDALIAKKERLVELLQEERQAFITQAVTKGLDPRVPMKDSDVEWLGAMPAGWRVSRIKHIMSRIVDCPHETPEVSPDFEYPAVRTTDVERGRLNLVDAQRVSEETYRERTRRLVPEAGDILYSREGRFGHAALVPPGVKLCLGQRMMMFRTRREHIPDYFMWVLNAECVFRQVTRDTIGAVASRVNIPTVSNALVPCPPPEVQREIAARIDAELKRIDRALSAVSRSVELLRKFRQATITAAVTGKSAVTEEAA